MKLKDNFILRQVADNWVVLPLANATAEFNGMLTLNETGAILWESLEQGYDRERLAEKLTEEYIVDYAQALLDIDEFLEKLREVGCLEV